MLKKAVLLLTLFASPALAQEPQCASFDEIVRAMKGGEATPFMYILSEDGKSLVVFFGIERTGEWMAFRRDADSDMACAVDHGVGFGVIPEYRGPGI